MTPKKKKDANPHQSTQCTSARRFLIRTLSQLLVQLPLFCTAKCSKTWATENVSPRVVIFSIFLRRSISRKSQKHSISKGLHCYKRHPVQNKYQTSLRHFLTALNFRKCSDVLTAYSPECCIICLIYINRLIAFTEMPLTPTNWRPLVLCSLLVAQKVWDDRYLQNSDFAFIYPFFVTEEINKLEKKFLELIQYNVTVKSHLYARYYFELRALFKDNEKEFPARVLTKKEAEKLELSEALFSHQFDKPAHKDRLNSSFGGTSSKPMWE